MAIFYHFFVIGQGAVSFLMSSVYKGVQPLQRDCWHFFLQTDEPLPVCRYVDKITLDRCGLKDG